MTSSSTRARCATLLLAAALVIACNDKAPPRDQWTIFIGTDATVPQVGDRLLVEVVDESGEVCSSCRRQFGAADPDTWPLSMGVAPREDGRRLGVRARLYRTEITGDDGLPGTDRHIDAFAWLPDAPGISEVALELRMSCFGVLAAVGSTCDPATGAVGAAPELEVAVDAASGLPRPGSWELAGPGGCEGVVPGEGEICIPGGAFLLGSPRYLPLGEDLISVPEQLITLSPFLIDSDEMTVGTLRPLVESGRVRAPAGFTGSPFCTWGRGDDLPVNCNEWEDAAAACEALGKRLPTEAEWEYVASNLQLESDYPWLESDADPCEQSIVDQNRGRCRPSGEAVGPIAGGSPLDVTLLGVRNMSGNVSEWVADRPNAYVSPDCWGEVPRLHSDPVCNVPNPRAPETHSIRGASWNDDPFALRSSNRNGSSEAGYSLGLRCARSIP